MCDSAATNRDLAVKRRGHAIGNAAFHLRGHAIGVDRETRIDRANHARNGQFAVDNFDLDDLGDDRTE